MLTIVTLRGGSEVRVQIREFHYYDVYRGRDNHTPRAPRGQSKGSAVEIAEAFRQKRLKEERLLHSEGKQRARRPPTRLNSGSAPSNVSGSRARKSSPVLVSAEMAL